MPIEVVVPRLGWSMDEGTFGEWLKRDGEFVARGEMLFILEGEKASQEIESFDEGILRIPAGAPQPGDTVRVGQVLAFLVAEGEAAPSAGPAGAASSANPQAPAKAAAPATAVDAPSETAAPHVKSDRVKASPRARRLAVKARVDLSTVTATGSTGRIRECDVAAVA